MEVKRDAFLFFFVINKKRGSPQSGRFHDLCEYEPLVILSGYLTPSPIYQLDN